MTSTERPRGFGSDSPTGSGRARGSPQVESELARVQNALAVAEEARRKDRLVVWPSIESFYF